MALAALQLDDLTWAQLVEASRRRIIAASSGAWTLHAPVDPGVTLLELFAWLLEQRVFLADQVTPEITRALLALLGERTLPATPAATVVQLETSAQPLTLDAGTELRLQSSKRARLVFSLESSLMVAPLAGPLQLSVDGVPRSADLGVRPIELAIPGNSMEVKIQLPLAAPLPAIADAPLGLLVELETGPRPGSGSTAQGVQQGWVPGEPSSVPPPADVSWWHRNAQGALVQWKPPALVDGTAGLRRSGVVQLPAADWSPDTAAPNQYTILLRGQQTNAFSFPPRLLRLELNAVEAQHRRRVALQPFHAAWLPLAGAPELELNDENGPVIAETVQLSIRERDGAWHEWQPVDRLSNAGPDQRVFTVDRQRGLLGFGDGLTGRIPVLFKPEDESIPNVELRYQAGGGAIGNFAAGQSFDVESHADLEAISLVDAVGGADPEPLSDGRDRTQEDLREVTRAVLAADYETLAVTTQGVGIARAHAAVGVHPSFSCLAVPGAVTVVVLPWAPRPSEPGDSEEWDQDWTFAPQPDPGALSAVRARLDAARLIASEVYVRGPIYRPAKLLVRLQGDPRDPLALRSAVTRRLRRFLDPLSGGEDGSGWPFGEPLRPSALLREVQSAIGREAEAMAVEVVLDGKPPPNDCTDVDIGAHHLAELDAVEVALQRVVPVRGGLR
jgi:hypothetical protein